MYEIKPLTKEKTINNRKLCRAYIKYKRKSLRNHGEYPAGKKVFRELFYSIISKSTEDILSENPNHFFVMQSNNHIIGFASISTKSEDVVDIPYTYGEVKDFYISPKYRRKGFGRILNEHIENVFKQNGTSVVLLSPDPVSGIDFWKAMGYFDTGIHQGWGRHFVYIKHITENENTFKIDNAIQNLVTPTDLIGINLYNKKQIKEAVFVWRKHGEEHKQKFRKTDIKKMAFNARNNKSVSFKALYFKGEVIGLFYSGDKTIRYILPEYGIFEEKLK